MTAFLVIVIIAIIYDINIKHKKTSMEYRNIRRDKLYKEKYNKYTESLTKEYKEIASKYDIYELYKLPQLYVKQTTDIDNIKKTINEKYHLSDYYEAKWLCIVGKACGKLNDNFVNYIYENNIWEDMPEEVNETYIEDFKEKHKSAINGDDLELSLKCACIIKKIIISDKDFGFYDEYKSEIIMKQLNDRYPQEEYCYTLSRLINKIIKKEMAEEGFQIC